MSKCRICGTEGDGKICRHCVAKIGSGIINGVKSTVEFAGKALAVVGPIALMVATKGKNKNV